MMIDGLVYWSLTPQQQPGSYRGSFLVEETGLPRGNHRPTASNWWNFSHIRPLPSPGNELGPQRCEAKWAKAWRERHLSSLSYRGPVIMMMKFQYQWWRKLEYIARGNHWPTPCNLTKLTPYILPILATKKITYDTFGMRCTTTSAQIAHLR